jgi:hypothetical protein
VGYDQCRFEVVARVSRHNSPKDDRHDALWEGLCERLRSIVEEPEYEEINAWVV